MLVAAIIVCEVMFWVVLCAGLTARYVLRRRRLSTVLLVSVPLVDLALLTVTVLDLRRGGMASTAHGLAAIYLGVSVAFGHRLIAWADVRFAHRFAGGPAPRPRPRYGAAHARAQRGVWVRHVLAWAVGCALMGLAVLAIADPSRTQSLSRMMQLWSVVLVIDGAISLSYTFSPRRAPAAAEQPRVPAGR